MSLIVDVAADRVRSPVSRARIKEIAVAVLKAERVRDALISITLVSRPHIARLNRGHLGHRGATDVISFSFEATPRPSRQRAVVGDIYIAPDVAKVNASRLGRGVREEIARLVVHGTLHVLGHDHPGGDDRTRSAMWRRQERLLFRVTNGAAARSRAR